MDSDTDLSLKERLLEWANSERNNMPDPAIFTGHPEADALLNNLTDYPHAYVIACIMDRQVPFERAWMVPHKLRTRLGFFDFPNLARLSEEEILAAMCRCPPLHRFSPTMGRLAYRAIRRIETEYSGDASRIWSGNPSSQEVVWRFLGFEGVGPKIANMAANILLRELHVPMSDKSSIDVSVDVHVRRVFVRLGLVPDYAVDEMIVAKGRELSPEYPGLLDLVLWNLGREICRKLDPLCAKCRLSDLCSFVRT